MKKLVLVLAIALIAVPSFGAFTISLLQQGTSNVYDVNYVRTGTDANLPRAFALVVNVTGGATISAISNVKTGESTPASKGFGIFPGSIVIDACGVVTSPGTPVAPATYPGAAGTGLGTSTVVLEMGSLYDSTVSGSAPAASGRLCSLTLLCGSATGTQTLSLSLESAFRGGLVLENGTQPTPTLVGSSYTCAAPECFDSGHPDYAKWVTAGRPSCWCYTYQCRGDADGLVAGDSKNGFYQVGALDLGVLQGAWQVKEAPKGPGLSGNQICADFDRTLAGDSKNGFYHVGALDLGILQGSWQVKNPPKGPGLATGCGGL